MKRYIFILSFFVVQWAFSQTHVISHDIDWSTTNQNMWGPDGNPTNINMDLNLFEIDHSDNFSVGDIAHTFLGDFGAVISVDDWIHIGSDFVISGFTTGYVNVDYPVKVNLEVPNDNTFCPGDTVTIKSSYNVRPGWDLDTHFPSAGVIGLYLDFGFHFQMDATICVFSCTSFDIINLNVPLDTIPIIELNTITGEFSYPCFNPTSFPPFTICHDNFLPITFSIPAIGLTGSITIPYVETHDWLENLGSCEKNLYARGDCTWVRLQIDIIQLLSTIAGFIPPPTGPLIQQILSNLSGSFSFAGGAVTIDYTLFAAYFTILSTMRQDFSFEPTVWNTLTFSQPIDYFVTDPNNGNAIVDSGFSNQVRYKACQNLNFKWPCHGVSQMDIQPLYSLTNEFRNHTWDSISFDFTITAFEFWININLFRSIPALEVPEFCVDLPTDTVFNLRSSSHQICFSNVSIPPMQLSQQDFSIHIGPLFSYTWPLGYIPITWFDETWELAGFHDTLMPPFTMKTNCPALAIDHLDVDQIKCYGDSTGRISIYITGGRPPYTYQWSNGFAENNTNNTSSTIDNLHPGWYYITVTDYNGCFVIDSAEIIYLYPPLAVDTNIKHVTCEGGSDGYIELIVSGGANPYTYTWSPTLPDTPNIYNLPAGTYTCTITDNVGCDTVVSYTLIELYPLPTINVIATPKEGCQPLEVQFQETSPDEGQTYFWDLDEGEHFSYDKNPFFIYTKPGVYDVFIIVTSVHGCVDSMRFPDMITVYEKPVADFRPYPTNPDLANSIVTFLNLSTNTYQSEWYFSDGGTFFGTNAIHEFTDTGKYLVTLYITTEHGCRDTAQQYVYVRDIYTIFVPNSITPDGDHLNDVFKPVGYNLRDDNYLMQIFDRWGKMIFESKDINIGWDGKLPSGDKAPAGIYAYRIQYLDKDGLTHVITGFVNVLR